MLINGRKVLQCDISFKVIKCIGRAKFVNEFLSMISVSIASYLDFFSVFLLFNLLVLVEVEKNLQR